MTPFFKNKEAPYDGRFAMELVSFIAGMEEVKKGFSTIGDEARSVAELETVVDKERAAAEIYRRTERFLIATYPTRFTAIKLRETFNKKLHADDVGEGCSLIFIGGDMRAMAFFRLFVNALVFRTSQALGEDNFKTLLSQRFGDKKLVEFYTGKAAISWKDFRAFIANIPSGERRLKIQEEFTRLTSFLLNMLREHIQDARTQLIVEDIYRTFKKEYTFLEDLPVVLSIVADQNILKDERVGMWSKTALAEHARIQTRKVEETLAQLQYEKTKLEEALKALEESQEKLKALDYAKGQFIDVVSHQFRTPLSTIRWSAEMLRDEFGTTIPEQGRGFLDTVSIKAIFLINILNDIFDVLQLEAGNLKLQKKPGQLWEMVADQSKAMETEAQKHNIKIIFEKSATAIREVSVDHELIRRVIEILLRNAINYSPEKGGEVTIKMGEQTIEGKNYVWIGVTDNGIGISEEDLPKMYNKFFRAVNAIRRVPDGAGLGLYIVRNIIELHGGRVAVTSKLGEGSTFLFYIPSSESAVQ